MAKPTKHIFTTGQVVTNKQGQQAIVKQKEARGYSFTALGGVYEYDFHCANTSIISSGEWRHNTVPVVHGRGFKGIGIHSLSKSNHLATVWRGMMNRCYDKEYHKATPTYTDCTVCTKWFDFQVFCEDVTGMLGYDSVDYNGRCFYFDKDILSCSKVYSKETCCFVPQSVNILFRDIDVIPTGSKKGSNYRTKGLGSFKTQEELQCAHAKVRIDKATDLMRIYSGKIDQRVMEKLNEVSLGLDY